MSNQRNSGDELTAALDSTIVETPLAERVGVEIGTYKLMEQIGEGGFGLVFVAEQQKPVQRRVALKVIKPGMDTQDVIARFEAERQALALMDHPNIARVLDAGTTGSGRPYFVMELVRGIPITDYCDQNQLTPRERLELFIDVCNAVQHAHQKGIIHRDIKPSNVLVTLHDGRPIVKVIDFGVAKALHQKLTDRTIYTRFSQMVGTPLYMSPEQAEMSGLDIDTRTDIYSLGVLMYELLTGTTPFDKKRISQAAYGELIRMIRDEEPPKPSTRLSQSTASLPTIAEQRKTEPARLSKMFRGDLDWITMKALEKDRTRRYETANAFAADVQRYLADEPVEASPPSATYRVRKFVRRHRRAVMTGSAFVGLLIVGVLVTSWLAVRQAAARASADRNAQLAEAETEKAQRRVELAIDAIESFRRAVDGNLDVKNRPENASLRKTLLQAPLSFYQKLRDDLCAGGEVGPAARAKLADAYLSLASLDQDIGSQAEALTAYDEAVALYEQTFLAASQEQKAAFRTRLARALGERGRLQSDSQNMAGAALDSLRRAQELLEASVGENPDDVAARVSLAGALDGRARLEGRKGDVDAALGTLRRSIGVLEEGNRRTQGDREVGVLLAATHLQVSELLDNRRSRLPEALASAETALQIAEPLARANPGDVGCQQQQFVVYGRLGAIHAHKGEENLALKSYEEQLRTVEQMVRVHPTVNRFKVERVDALENVALTQCSVGRNTESLANLQKARDFALGLVRENPTNTGFQTSLASAWTTMAHPLLALGRRAEALTATQSGVSALEEVSRAEPDNVDVLRQVAGYQYNCGILNEELGRFDAAMAAYENSLVLRERLARTHPDQPRLSQDVASTLGNMAVIHYKRKHFSEARALLERAAETLEKLARAHPDNAEYESYFLRARSNLGSTLSEMGQLAAAIDVLRAARESWERFNSKHPGVVQYQLELAEVLRNLADALRKVGKPDEAAAALEKAIEILAQLLKSDPGDQMVLQHLVDSIDLQANLERDRKHPAAVTQSYQRAFKMLDGVSAQSSDQLYNLCCFRARLAAAAAADGSGMTADEVRAEADKAMAVLLRAVASGFRDAEQLRKDTDLESLRKREDFKKLITNLASGNESAKKP